MRRTTMTAMIAAIALTTGGAAGAAKPAVNTAQILTMGRTIPFGFGAAPAPIPFGGVRQASARSFGFSDGPTVKSFGFGTSPSARGFGFSEGAEIVPPAVAFEREIEGTTSPAAAATPTAATPSEAMPEDLSAARELLATKHPRLLQTPFAAEDYATKPATTSQSGALILRAGEPRPSAGVMKILTVGG